MKVKNEVKNKKNRKVTRKKVKNYYKMKKGKKMMMKRT